MVISILSSGRTGIQIGPVEIFLGACGQDSFVFGDRIQVHLVAEVKWGDWNSFLECTHLVAKLFFFVLAHQPEFEFGGYRE